jgi:hypothetical protein
LRHLIDDRARLAAERVPPGHCRVHEGLQRRRQDEESAPSVPPPEQEIIADPPEAFGGDPGHPHACVPPPPDLDCGDIAHRRCNVLPPDPQYFDGDSSVI